MSEVDRPVDSDRFTEIRINTGATAEEARRATTTPIIIATRPAGTQPGGMAALILQVPDLDRAIAAVRANGGALAREPFSFGDLSVAFVTDPDGNEIELIMSR